MSVCVISRAPLSAGGQTQIKLCLVWPSRGLSVGGLGTDGGFTGERQEPGGAGGSTSVLQIQRPGFRGLRRLKAVWGRLHSLALPLPSRAGLAAALATRPASARPHLASELRR